MTADLLQDVRRWTFDLALPWWSENATDKRNGGFVESFDLNGLDAGSPFKRTRVACRQMYVFSHASLLGFKDGARLIDLGADYLARIAWMPDAGAFARRLTREGEVLDPTIDLYDHAFALFACGWRLKATGERDALSRAHRTLDAVERHLSHPSGDGFWHQIPATGWRQQNPHMHMTEAMLVLYEASHEQRFADLAVRLTKLFHDRFFDPESGTLAEFFADDWSRAPGEDGRRTEPGHQLEWAWILKEAGRLLGVDYKDDIRALVRFAEAHGVDPYSHAAYNAVRDDGTPIDRGSRTWPNTERLKAAVALFEIDGKDPGAIFQESGRLLLDRYLATQIQGLWIDAFDETGVPLSADVPSSTLYHVFLAFAEVMRAGRIAQRSLPGVNSG